MLHLQQEFDAGPEDVIEVVLNGVANVMLLDDQNYDHYLKGEHFRYYGGLAEESPMRLIPPTQGHWHAVVDLGGSPGRIKVGFMLLQSSGATR